jgi:aminodeoxyfutalosine synthase
MKEIPDNIRNKSIRYIADKVISGIQLTPAEGLLLFTDADLSLLSWLSGIVRRRINGNEVYFISNFHIEPTNKCVYNCRFCSYHKPASDPESWEYSHDEMLEKVKSFDTKDITEVHIVGGVHPLHDLHYYCDLIQKIKKHRPSLHIKAFSAIELDYMIKKAGLTVEEGLEMLKECGLGSIPGGGAEIFDEKIRTQICPEKTSSEEWLSIHKQAHKKGISSNSTMLYGHIENYENRIEHMVRLRDLQEKTGGFNAFIPLKYKKENNTMSYLGEVSMIEDLRNYAVSRIFLDNIPHIKAYWPMTGKELAQLSLLFGTDDLDGTIEDTTRIYSMAGAGEQNPSMTKKEIQKLITEAGFIPVERDSLYNRL